MQKSTLFQKLSLFFKDLKTNLLNNNLGKHHLDSFNNIIGEIVKKNAVRPDILFEQMLYLMENWRILKLMHFQSRSHLNQTRMV